jgi:hypothetical protein
MSRPTKTARDVRGQATETYAKRGGIEIVETFYAAAVSGADAFWW